MCGVQFNRGRIILTLLFIPIMVIYLFVDYILIACAQDPYISKVARDYVVGTLPGLFVLVQFDCRRRFL